MLATDKLPLAEYPAARKTERYAGIYSVALAARLVRIPLRHARSYARQRDGDGKPWGKQSCRREHYLNFRDLMELRVAWALHKSGMKWREICQFARCDAEKAGSQGHVLSHGRFLVQGSRLFELVSEDPDLEGLTMPIEYDEQGVPVRWNISREWNFTHGDAAVMIDPQLSFGYPVLADCHVPTYILHDALLAENGDHYTVAEDYEVSVAQVRLACQFEKTLWGDDAVSA